MEVEKVGNGCLTEGLFMKLHGAIWASIGPEVMDNVMTSSESLRLQVH